MIIRKFNLFDRITNYFVPNNQEFGKNYRSKIGLFQGYVSAFINSLLFIIKLFFGITISSVSLIADAVHTFSDVITSFVVIWGFKQTQKPSHLRNPYGHGKAEYVATLIISVLLIVVGIEFFKTALERIQNPIPLSPDWWIIALLLITIFLKEITARFADFLSKKIASGLLHADAWHHRTDAISSILVVMALIGGLFGYPFIDGYAGLGVALILIYAGFEIAKESVNELIGKPPTSDEIELIRKIGSDTKNILGVHDIVVHTYGQEKFISVHLEVDESKSAAEYHDISEDFESKMFKILGANLTVHLDPVFPNNPMVKKIKNLLKIKKEEDSRVLDFHDIRVVNTKNHQVILFRVLLALDMDRNTIITLKDNLSRFLNKKFKDYEINIKVSRPHKY